MFFQRIAVTRVQVGGSLRLVRSGMPQAYGNMRLQHAHMKTAIMVDTTYGLLSEESLVAQASVTAVVLTKSGIVRRTARQLIHARSVGPQRGTVGMNGSRYLQFLLISYYPKRAPSGRPVSSSKPFSGPPASAGQTLPVSSPARTQR